MEKVIKLQSDNSITQTFNNVATKPTNKLVDFTIPSGSVFDLSRSYVAINIIPKLGNVTDTNALTPVFKIITGLTTQATFLGSHLCNQSTLVKNVQFYSQNQGMVESVRRVDTLKMIQHYLETDDIEIQRDLNSLGASQGERGAGLFTSDHLDEVRISDSDGIGDGDGKNVSRMVARDYKIMLKDLLGCGKVQTWNTNHYGDCKLHLELNLDKLFGSCAASGAENATAFASGVNQGAYDAQNNINGGTPISSVVLTELYDDPQFRCPFFVGQQVSVTTQGSVTGQATVVSIIKNLNYDPTTKKITMVFSGIIFTATGAGENMILNTMVSIANPTIELTINHAELNLVELKNPKNPSKANEFITYATEELDGNSLATVHKQLKIDPLCQTVYIASCDSNQIAPDRAIKEYRIAVDNKDISGNREIVYGKSLHKERIIRAYKNKSVPLKNLELKLLKISDVQANLRTTELACIVEPITVKNEEQNMNLELTNDANVQNLIVYKEVIKQI